MLAHAPPPPFGHLPLFEVEDHLKDSDELLSFMYLKLTEIMSVVHLEISDDPPLE